MNSNPDLRTQPLSGTTNAKRMSKTRKVVLIISGIVIALVLVSVLGIAIIISAFRGNPPSIRDNSVLVLKVAGPLPDYVPDDPFRRLFGGQPLSLNSLLYRGYSVMGVYVGAYKRGEADEAYRRTVWQEINELVLDGRIRPLIAMDIGLEDTADALTELVERRILGKVVVRPG